MNGRESSRWPKALRILTEHGPQAKGVSVYTLVCSAAYCEACGWKGPLRDDSEEPLQDRARHLDEVENEPWHIHLVEQLKKRQREEIRKQKEKLRGP